MGGLYPRGPWRVGPPAIKNVDTAAVGRGAPINRSNEGPGDGIFGSGREGQYHGSPHRHRRHVCRGDGVWNKGKHNRRFGRRGALGTAKGTGAASPNLRTSVHRPPPLHLASAPHTAIGDGDRDVDGEPPPLPRRLQPSLKSSETTPAPTRGHCRCRSCLNRHIGHPSQRLKGLRCYWQSTRPKTITRSCQPLMKIPHKRPRSSSRRQLKHCCREPCISFSHTMGHSPHHLQPPPRRAAALGVVDTASPMVAPLTGIDMHVSNTGHIIATITGAVADL